MIPILKVALAAMFVYSALQVVRDIGKKRQPITANDAVISIIIVSLTVIGLLN